MKKTIILVGLVLGAQMALASGYEKSIMFGGQTSGVAGNGTAYMQGSQALYFNPAGLATDKEGKDVSFNLSLTSSKFKAPVGNSSIQESSTSKLTTPVSLMYAQSINDKLGFGAGIYVSGGSSVEYDNLKLGGGAIKGDFQAKNNLQVIEAAVGVGYKLLDNLKVGIAYRITMAKADLATIIPKGGFNYAQVNLDNLKDTNYQGFKLGAQYKLGKTDIGFAYRSETVFHAKGTQNVVVHNNVSSNVLSSTADVTAGTLFPASWTLGAKHACTDTWNVYGEYNFTEYGKVDNISTESAGASTPIVLKMKDQHLVRLAGEYTGLMMPIRFGYIYGSQVTNSDYALPTATPPGVAHVVTVGTGWDGGAWRVDGGLEYNTVKGTGNTSGVANGAQNEANAYSLHLGASMMF
jgi:long-subunit fatty acid transport protein